MRIDEVYAMLINNYDIYPNDDISEKKYRDYLISAMIKTVPPSKAIYAGYLLSVGVMIAKSIQGFSIYRIIRVLFDSGSTGTLVHSRVMPPDLIRLYLKKIKL